MHRVADGVATGCVLVFRTVVENWTIGYKKFTVLHGRKFARSNYSLWIIT